MKFLSTFFSLLFLCVLATSIYAQTAPPVKRTLPPSLEAELRRSQVKIKAPVIYHDTLRGSAKVSALARSEGLESDSVSIADSEISVVDSSVSTPQKEWLDSQIVEVPEMARFGDKVHFDYPPQIMVETQRKSVPFDTTILARMNPVTRENLPFFDQSPLPLPLTQHAPKEGHIDAGGGLGYLPNIDASASFVLNERSAIDFTGGFLSRPSPSDILSRWKIDASATAELGPDDPEQAFQSAELYLNSGLTGKKTSLFSDIAGEPADHTLSNLQAQVALKGNATETFQYQLSSYARSFSDNYGSGLNEASHGFHAKGAVDLGFSHFHLEGAIDYDGAGDIGTLVPLTGTSQNSTGSSSSTLVASRYALLVGQKDNEQLAWMVGAEFLRAADIDGSRTSVAPIIRATWTLNPRWELGGSIEPQLIVADAYDLATINPFYNPLLARDQLVSKVPILASNLGDPRRVTKESFDARFFTTYMLSADDNLHAEMAIINRDHEVIFNERTLTEGHSVFYTLPESTRRITASFSGNFLVATKDIATIGFDFSSAEIDSLNTNIPFEPMLRFDANYAFNSLWDKVKPSVEYRLITRESHSLSFLNLAVRFELSSELSILAKAENILGGPSDFWTSYNEAPRAVWATLRYVW